MIERTAADLLGALSRREITSEALTGHFLRAIDERDPRVKAYLHVDKEQARQAINRCPSGQKARN